MNKAFEFLSYLPRFVTNPMNIIFYAKGVLPYKWKRLSKRFLSDFYDFKAPLKTKIWAYSKGFLAESVDHYGITKENHQLFISDLEFNKTSSYKNRRLSRWFDDKLQTLFVLAPYKDYLPIHYYSIVNGKIRQLYDFEKKHDNTFDGIFDILNIKKELIVKKTWGSKGTGVYYLQEIKNKYSLNGNFLDLLSKDQLKTFLVNQGDILITEYIYAHKVIQQFYNKTPNSIRIITTYDPEHGAQVTGAFIKIGVKESGFKDNLVEGGILAGIKLNTGEIFNPVQYKNKKIFPCEIHPDTRVKISGHLPNWSFISQKIKEISNYLNNTPFLGYDIIITNESFKILEVNSHGSTWVQIWYPFYENEYQKRLFLKQH